MAKKSSEEKALKWQNAEKAVNLGTSVLDSVGGVVAGAIVAKNTQTINENKSFDVKNLLWLGLGGVLLLVVGFIVVKIFK